MRRSRRTDWWPLVVLLVVLGLSTGFAAKAAFRLTTRYLSGVWRTYSQNYPASQQAAQAFAAIVQLVKIQQHVQARAALEAWLISFDTFGVVRRAIDANEIEESVLDYFVPLPR